MADVIHLSRSLRAKATILLGSLKDLRIVMDLFRSGEFMRFFDVLTGLEMLNGIYRILRNCIVVFFKDSLDCWEKIWTRWVWLRILVRMGSSILNESLIATEHQLIRIPNFRV